MRGFFLSISFLLAPFLLKSQCPVISVQLTDPLCLNEEIAIVNSSAPDLEFQWDFCPASLENPLEEVNLVAIPSAVRPFGLDYARVGDDHFIFVVNRTSNSITRFKFVNDLSTVPEIQTLGNVSGVLSNPQSIAMHFESGNWYALITNRDSELIRVDFGVSIENDAPTAVVSQTYAGIENLRGITIVEEENDFYAVLAAGGNDGQVMVLDFGASITNTPITLSNSFSAGRFPTGISLYRQCDQWFGIVSSDLSNRLFRFSYGNSITNTPTSEQIFGISAPRGISLNRDFNQYYAYSVSASNGNLIRFDFGENYLDANFSVTDVGDVGVDSWAAGFKVFKVDGEFYYAAAGFNDSNLIVRRFSEDCGASIGSSTDDEPAGVSFNSDGYKRIEAIATDSQGLTTLYADSVYVRAAPRTQFLVQNFCENQLTTFTDQTITDNTNITDWSWDFGDPASGGNNSSVLQNPQHMFTGAGDYNVVLQTTDDCGVISDTTILVRVIPENDLQPSFVIPTGECSNSPIQFNDLSSTTNDIIVGWLWDFGDPGSGSENTSTLQNPTHSFSAGGDFDISLTITGASGCQQTLVNPGGSPISVITGPVADFSFQNSCAASSVQFTDLSTGTGIISWDWDFGNGTSSTLQNPSVFYGDPGTYTVMLTIASTSGCTTSLQQEITIFGIPQVAFSNDLACDAEMTQFFDLTVIPNANPIQWDWDFGDGQTSNLQNPMHQFPAPGDYMVKLVVTSNFGCRDSLEQLVTVNSSPVAAFSFNSVCSGGTIFFQDESTAGSGQTIIDWLWQIDGQIITEQNPVIIFPDAGDYPIELTITSDNLCTETIVQTVTVNEAPFIEFNVINACSQSFTHFDNISMPGGGDEIVSYFWDFNGLGSSTSESPNFVFEIPGQYIIDLTIETENGCAVSLSKTIDIETSPVASFVPDVIVGSPPMEVFFDNFSDISSSYLWDFGTGDTSTEVEPTYVFNTVGDFEVVLIARNENCNDTTSQLIRVLTPELDVFLEEMIIVQNGGDTEIQLQISNRGSVVIDDMDFQIDLGGRASVLEPFEGSLPVGGDLSYTLNTSPIISQGIDYLCVTLLPYSDLVNEDNTANNKDCTNESGLFLQLEPYPNPVIDLVSVDFVVPEPGTIEVTVLDLTGKEVNNFDLTALSPGLSSFNLDLSAIEKGVYLIRSQYGNTVRTQKIIVN